MVAMVQQRLPETLEVAAPRPERAITGQMHPIRMEPPLQLVVAMVVMVLPQTTKVVALALHLVVAAAALSVKTATRLVVMEQPVKSISLGHAPESIFLTLLQGLQIHALIIMPLSPLLHRLLPMEHILFIIH
jgi:hypothetical protein